MKENLTFGPGHQNPPWDVDFYMGFTNRTSWLASAQSTVLSLTLLCFIHWHIVYNYSPCLREVALYALLLQTAWLACCCSNLYTVERDQYPRQLS